MQRTNLAQADAISLIEGYYPQQSLSFASELGFGTELRYGYAFVQAIPCIKECGG